MREGGSHDGGDGGDGDNDSHVKDHNENQDHPQLMMID